MKNIEKTKIIILLFFLFYLFFGFAGWLYYGTPNNTNDFLFHYEKIRGIEETQYKPLYHILFLPFQFNPLLFYIPNLIIIVCLIPFLLFQITKTYWSTITYFLGVSLPHQFLYSATYPSAFVLALFLIHLTEKDNLKLLLFLSVIASFTHSYGFALFAFAWILKGLELVKKTVWPFVFLQVQQLRSPRELIGLFISQIPLPVFLIGFFHANFYEKSFILFSLFASFVDFRAVIIAQTFIVISFSRRVETYSNKFKTILIVFFLLQFCFYFLDFVFGSWKHLSAI